MGSKKYKVGIFGSAFNPPTLGHKNAIEQALKMCDKVVLIPSYSHPEKSNITDFDTRVLLTSSFIEDNFKNFKVTLSEIEKDINSHNESFHVYTFNVLDHLSLLMNKKDFAFIIGEDNFDNFESRFLKSQYLKDTYNIEKVNEENDIRSTTVRNNVKENKDISHLTSKGVRQIIKDKSLYI